MIPAAMSPAPVTQTSTRIRVVTALSTSAVGMPTRTVEPSPDGTACTRYPPSPESSTSWASPSRGTPAASRAFCWESVSASVLSRASGPPFFTTFDSVTEPSETTAPNVLNGWPPPIPMKSSGSSLSGPPGVTLPLPG